MIFYEIILRYWGFSVDKETRKRFYIIIIINTKQLLHI